MSCRAPRHPRGRPREATPRRRRIRAFLEEGEEGLQEEGLQEEGLQEEEQEGEEVQEEQEVEEGPLDSSSDSDS